MKSFATSESKRENEIDSIKVFYDNRMVADSGGYSPSALKPAEVVNDWGGSGLPVDVCGVSPASAENISSAHDPTMVRRILAGDLDNGHGNRDLTVAGTFPWTVGSHYDACVEAIRSKGSACSPTSGFHHAGYDQCHGFCTFNGLMVSANRLLRAGRVSRVGIVDYDYHFGDGTMDIINILGRHGQVVNIDAGIYSDSNHFLSSIRSDMDAMGSVDLVIYQAGADMHVEDPLGGLLATSQLAERDKSVFGWCRDNRVPVAWNLAGGYQRKADGSIPKVLEIHRNTMAACCEVFCGPATFTSL